MSNLSNNSSSTSKVFPKKELPSIPLLSTNKSYSTWGKSNLADRKPRILMGSRNASVVLIQRNKNKNIDNIDKSKEKKEIEDNSTENNKFRGNWNPSLSDPINNSFIPNSDTINKRQSVYSKEYQEETITKLNALRESYSNINPPEIDINELSDDSLSNQNECYDNIDYDEMDPPSYTSISDVDENEENIYDDSDYLAIISNISENEGAETLEECKMVVQWGENGKPPPIPSRDDISHKLSEEQALQFIKQREEIPEAYQIILDDPRLQRLRLKWAPNIFTKEGAVQFAKKKMNPGTLPYVGVLFHANHIRESKHSHDQVEKISQNVPEELENSMTAFKHAHVIRGIQNSAYTGVYAACMFLPVVEFIPGLSAQLMVVGAVGSAVAETGIEMGLKVIITKAAKETSKKALDNTDAFGGYGTSKAFLLYLGYPKTDDPLYAHWEPYRLKLKALYGCAAEDDLSKMKPKGDLLKQLKKEEKHSGKPYQVEIPLLVLLYRAFHCWEDLYWDRMVKTKNKATNKTRKVLGLQRELTLEERRRMRDYRKLQDSAAVIEEKNAINPHLKIIRKNRKKDIINLFTESLLHSHHVSYLFSRKLSKIEQKKHLKWFMTKVVDYFMANNAFFWAYIGTDNELKAVTIWDRPNEKASISFLSLLTASSSFSLPTNRWKKLTDVLFKMEDIRKRDIRGLRCWMLHWIAVHPLYQKQGIGRLMIENTIRRHNEPIYIQLFNVEEEMIEFVNKLCFVPVCHEDAKFKIYGKPVTLIAYWFGINSPSELKALLPQKKKTTLQLTYNSFKKVSSLQSVGNINSSLLSSSQNTLKQKQKQQQHLLLDSEENKLYKEAKERYEEASTLLNHLKINLASLPTTNRDTDPIALILSEKIKEYSHIVQTYKISLEDAKTNLNSLKIE